MRFFITALFCLAALLTAIPAEAQRKDLTLGVLAFRPKAETRARWQPLADYLSRALHSRKIRLEVFTYPELEEAIARQELDFVLTNPGHYVQLRHKNHLSGPLATLVESGTNRNGAYFGGVIAVRRDRKDIDSLADLKGKRIAVISTGSLGGYQAQALELLHAGVRLPGDAIILETGMPHDLSLFAVLDGSADAGFVRTGVIESLAHEGLLDPSQLKVLAGGIAPEFAQALSTGLYPDWPFIALPHVEEGLARKAAAALLALDHGGAVARSCGIHGFGIPADYSPVENLLLELRLPPFDRSPEFTFADVWRRYHATILAALIGAVIISVLAVRLGVRNRELRIAITEIRTLRGIIPICSSCKKIRDEEGAWHQLETYISSHTASSFSHGLCRECAQKLYPDIYGRKEERKDDS